MGLRGIAVVLVLIAGCASETTYVELLPDPDGAPADVGSSVVEYDEVAEAVRLRRLDVTELQAASARATRIERVAAAEALRRRARLNVRAESLLRPTNVRAPSTFGRARPVASAPPPRAGAPCAAGGGMYTLLVFPARPLCP